MDKDNKNRKDNHGRLGAYARLLRQLIQSYDIKADPGAVLGARYAPLSQAREHGCECPADAADVSFQLPQPNERIIVMGASFGGTLALAEILGRFPENCPPTLIVQHMTPGVMDAFASHLNRQCIPEVRVARDRDVPRKGLVLLAPGARHMVLRNTGAGRLVRVFEGLPVHFQRPSVDVLFHSAARAAGSRAVGVLLTGMGTDGATGMSSLHQAGAHTVAQDEATSAMFGMPGAAVALGAVSHVLPLRRIAAHVLKHARGAAEDAAPRLLPLHTCEAAHHTAAN